jgi:hypothetical protein
LKLHLWYYFLIVLVKIPLPPQPLHTSLRKGGRAGRKGLNLCQRFYLLSMLEQGKAWGKSMVLVLGCYYFVLCW